MCLLNGTNLDSLSLSLGSIETHVYLRYIHLLTGNSWTRFSIMQDVSTFSSLEKNEKSHVILSVELNLKS